MVGHWSSQLPASGEQTENVNVTVGTRVIRDVIRLVLRGSGSTDESKPRALCSALLSQTLRNVTPLLTVAGFMIYRRIIPDNGVKQISLSAVGFITLHNAVLFLHHQNLSNEIPSNFFTLKECKAFLYLSARFHGPLTDRQIQNPVSWCSMR